MNSLNRHEVHVKLMKTQNTSIEMHRGTVRAGIISLLVLALCYLWMTGIADWPRTWSFIVLFSVCFVLMMQSIVDLLVLLFGLAAPFTGRCFGHVVRQIRHNFSHTANGV